VKFAGPEPTCGPSLGRSESAAESEESEAEAEEMPVVQTKLEYFVVGVDTVAGRRGAANRFGSSARH
jgi:hypothetical protein